MMRRRSYDTLDALRGVAALSVVLYHSSSMLGRIVPRGYLAVDLFFVLSGFVIAHAYDDRMRAGLSTLALTKIRVIRFYPLYIAGLLFGVAKELMLTASDNQHALGLGQYAMLVAGGALFIPAPIPQRMMNIFPLNVASWSLFFELVVNILYAATFRLQTRATLIGTMILSAAALLVLAPLNGVELVGAEWGTFAAAAARTLFSFSLGLILYRARLRAPRVPVPVLLAALFVLFLVPWGGPIYDFAFLFVLSPTIVLLGSSTEPSPGFGRIAHFLGVISFAIYALHGPAVGIAIGLVNVLHFPPVLTGAANILLLLGLCAFVAVPLDKRIRKRLSRRSHAAVARDPAEVAAP